VDTIVRALSEMPCRLMLADEVGLGKTIEAMAIIKGMLDKQPDLNSLIIVPDTLLYQWQTEISFKFWYDAPIWNVDELDDSQILIVSYADIIKDYDKISKLKSWDICVVDETHRLINNNSLYNNVLDLCKKTENLLLNRNGQEIFIIRCRINTD
jgi:ATP-dependent helicase HepA